MIVSVGASGRKAKNYRGYNSNKVSIPLGLVIFKRLFLGNNSKPIYLH